MFEKLKQIRTERDITVEQMAKVLNLETKAAYYKKESGSVKFSLDDAKKVADFLKMPIEDIFFDNEVSCKERKGTNYIL